MASEEETTSDSVSVRQIPRHLLNYLRSSILHYVAEESEFSAEIHQDTEQPARLVFSMGSKPQFKLEMEEQNTNGENGSTNVILVQNLPSLLDEEILELFFESTKKKGGGPVRNVKLNRQNNWALVEFVEPEGVQAVLRKRPITMLDATLDIQPYAPLIQGGEQMKNVEIRGLPKNITEDLHAMHLESIIDPSAVPDTTDRDVADVSKSKEANKHRASTIKSLRPVNTSASTSVDIKQVPSKLLNYLRSRVLHYFAEVNDFSAEIQQISGQPSQLIVLVGNKATRVQSDLLNAEGEINSTKAILVQNIPSSLDEDMIEAFFESTKKCGGGPVNKLELNIEKHWAVVEFSDPKAVRNVMNNKPIKMLGTTVDVQPYAPLLQGDGTIDGLCITGLPTELTEDVVAAHLENMLTMSAAGAGLVAGDNYCAGDTVTETFSVADSVKLRMLEECKFQEELNQRFRPIKTTVNEKALKIEVTFYRYDTKAIQSAKMYIYQRLHKIDLCLLSNMSQNCLDLFQMKQTIDDISNKLKTEKLGCVWEVRASHLAVCSFSEDISSCGDIISRSVKEKKILVPTLVDPFSIQSGPWQDMVAAVQDKFKGLCKIGVSEDSSEIYVAATDNVVEKILEEIQTYLKRYTMIMKSFSVKDLNLYRLDQIVNELSHHYVQIVERPNPTGIGLSGFSFAKQHRITVTGTAEALNQFEQRLNQ